MGLVDQASTLQFSFGVYSQLAKLTFRYIYLIIELISTRVGVEEFGSKQRAAAGVLLSIFWSLGAVAVGIGAYFLRQWRDLQLLCGLPLFLQISYYW